jgi:APA family basic amino acid/polyamine antiporter
MLAIGAVIGAGIFGAIGNAAAGQVGPDGAVIRYGAGPALVFSFILLGGACALSSSTRSPARAASTASVLARRTRPS